MEEKKKRLRPTLTEVRLLEKKLIDSEERYRTEVATLQRSNKLMEDELERLRKSREEWKKDAMDSHREIYRLKNRGLIARVFNWL